MQLARPELRPESGMSRDAMEALQTRVREQAVFEDSPRTPTEITGETVVGGIDIAFVGEDAVATCVAMQGGELREAATVRRPVALPYIPGLLAFREAGPMLAAIERISVDLDLLFCDGNGRIHPREAGLATHLGVAIDAPTLGVAKGLLCGQCRDAPPEPFAGGTRVPIVADESMTAPAGEIVGYAVQTRQWEAAGRHINPVYVSPGHLIGPKTAADRALEATAGYKLPEPIRTADRLAGEQADGE